MIFDFVFSRAYHFKKAESGLMERATKDFFPARKKESLRLGPRILTTILALFLGTAVLPAPALQEQQSNPAEWSRTKKEHFLREANVLRQKRMGKGITGSVRATLGNEEGIHDAQIQLVAEFKPRFESARVTEFDFKDTWKFNVAAYILDQILDINMVPVTVEREVDGQAASVTWWIDDVLMTEKDRYFKKTNPPDIRKWNQQMYVVFVFDELISNSDRNFGNLVITKNWDIWMIDHTRAFRTFHELRKPKKLVRCDRQLLENLRKLERTTLQVKLGRYLSALEIDGVLARRDAIVNRFDKKTAREGADSVLYDYLVERKSSHP